MKSLRTGLLASMLGLLIGCSHSLEIKNLSQYQAASLTTLPKQFSVGVATPNTEETGKTLVTGIANGLNKYAGSVIYPYAPSSSQPVDLITNINIHPDHKGSGANFFINFPGFLIWTPAWNGYVYHPFYKVDIELLRGSDNEKVDSFSVPISLDVRHADIGRTWTEISWFEVGIIAFISGFVFINYDDDITPMVETQIKTPIGEYIAQEITNRVKNSHYIEQIGQK